MLIFDYLFKATTLRSPTMILGQDCFISYSMKMSGLFMMVLRLYLESMKSIRSGHPKSTCLHNEMDVREGKTTITCGLCKQLGHNRRSCKNRNQVQ